MDYQSKSIVAHKSARGKLEIKGRMPVTDREELSLAYTPGVAGPCLEIAKDVSQAKVLTSSKNTVAVISDGTAVLGLGDIGPEAALPVMEGKAVLFKCFANLDSFPIVLGTKDTEEIISTIKNLAPTFGAINLEDISAPRCFEIERRLIEELNIPVMHDDQHGTAIVVLAGMINAMKITGRQKESVRIVINGAGAAGSGVTRLLHAYGFGDIIMCDSKGIVSRERTDIDDEKKKLLEITNNNNISGSLKDALKDSDVFIGLSKGNLLSAEDVSTMAKDSIIFAMANPTPEIMPDLAKEGGARIIATGRSDFPNQVNNVLAFPGIFKGALESGAIKITQRMKIAASVALADHVKNPNEDKIIPDPFDEGVAEAVAKAVSDNS